jgi:hypothetical protein|tara:strand:+ start:354 stop:494 length:141 start_codon:yes stop_codon:yes gene_type:complete
VGRIFTIDFGTAGDAVACAVIIGVAALVVAVELALGAVEDEANDAI